MAKNPAQNFIFILNRLKEISQDSGIPESEIIGNFIKDLTNQNNEGYDRKVKGLTITGLDEIDPSAKKTLISFLAKIEKKAKKTEERIRKEQDPKNIAQKAIREEEKAKRKEEQKVNALWNQICEIVEKKSKKEGIHISKCWVNLKNSRFPKDSDKELNDVELKIKKMVEDETYYQEIKYFTYDFKFLALDVLTANAFFGNSKRKFLDLDNYNRYRELRDSINTKTDENTGIQKLLMNDKIDNVTRRVLEERMEVIKTQKSFAYVDNGEER